LKAQLDQAAQAGWFNVGAELSMKRTLAHSTYVLLEEILNASYKYINRLDYDWMKPYFMAVRA